MNNFLYEKKSVNHFFVFLRPTQHSFSTVQSIARLSSADDENKSCFRNEGTLFLGRHENKSTKCSAQVFFNACCTATSRLPSLF